jgi:hypothetical protein
MEDQTGLEIVNFTNIDNSDFTGYWGGQPYLVKAGETKQFAKWMAEHFAKHLIDKILIKSGKDFGKDSLERKPLEDKILGKVAVPVEVKKEEVPPEVQTKPEVKVVETSTVSTTTKPEFEEKPKEPEVKPKKKSRKK